MLIRRQHGFTIVELMVALSIVALLAALAVPTMRSVVENSRIRSASQSMQNGLSLARADAVRLNTQVEFVIEDGNWTVQRVDTGEQLHQSTGANESVANGLTLTRTPANADRITFDAFGRRVAPNPDGTPTLTQLDIAATNPSGSSNYRPLTIQLLGSGMPRLCDPNAASSEPKACL